MKSLGLKVLLKRISGGESLLDQRHPTFGVRYVGNASPKWKSMIVEIGATAMAEDDNAYYLENWPKIQECVSGILNNREMTPMLEEYYQAINNLSRKEDHWKRLREEVSEMLDSYGIFLAKALGETSDLDEVTSIIQSFEKSKSLLSMLFRDWGSSKAANKCLNFIQLYTARISTAFIGSESIGAMLSNIVSSQVNILRSGTNLGTENIKRISAFADVIGMEPILTSNLSKSTSAFYKNAVDWSQSASEIIISIERIITFEERILAVFSPSIYSPTFDSLRWTVYGNGINERMNAFIPKLFSEDMEIITRFAKLLNALKSEETINLLSQSFFSFIKDETITAMSSIEALTIQKLIQILSKIQMAQKVFAHKLFAESNSYFCDEINKDSSRISFMLAQFANECIVHDETQQLFQIVGIVRVFRDIEDTEAFLELHRQFMAQRLIHNHKPKYDIEKILLNQISDLMGHESIEAFLSMIRDSKDSITLDISFHHPVFHPFIMESTSWPNFSEFTMKLPAPIPILQTNFTEFYASEHKGRKLRWVPILETVEFVLMETSFISTALQFVTLLAISESKKIDDTGIPLQYQVQIVESLVASGLIQKEKCSYRLCHFYPRLGVQNIASMMLSGPKQIEARSVEEALESRKNRVEASIVKIVKQQKEVDVDQLFKSIPSQFSVSQSQFSSYVSELVRKDLLSQKGRMLSYYID